MDRHQHQVQGRDGILLPGARIAVFCWILYTVTFHFISNLPIEKELYLGVHARFWMQSHVASHQILGIGAAGVARILDAVLMGSRATDFAGASASTALAVAVVAAQIGAREVERWLWYCWRGWRFKQR